MKEKYIENEYVECWLEDGIVYLVYKPEILSLAVAKQAVKTRLTVSDGKKSPIIIDIRNIIHSDNMAKKFLSSSEGLKFLTAGAFLIEKNLTRLSFNIFLKVFKPAIPSKAFPDEEEAIKWIHSLN